MDGSQIAGLVDQRWELLQELSRLAEQQAVAIEQGRMSELLSILRRKQPYLESFQRLSRELSQGCEPPHSDATRHPVDWSSAAEREACRGKHEACQRLHETLLRREAECEAKLQASRDRVEEQLTRSEGAKRAVGSYNASRPSPTTGGQLDLANL